MEESVELNVWTPGVCLTDFFGSWASASSSSSTLTICGALKIFEILNGEKVVFEKATKMS